jgi:c(7)-type cytochrome triheme protein
MKKVFIITMVSVCLLAPMGVLAQKLGGGDLTFTPKNALPVVFSHRKHMNEKNYQCTDCHYLIFQMARGSYEMHMDELSKGAFCGKCHNGLKAFDVKDKKNCSRCHR